MLLPDKEVEPFKETYIGAFRPCQWTPVKCAGFVSLNFETVELSICFPL